MLHGIEVRYILGHYYQCPRWAGKHSQYISSKRNIDRWGMLPTADLSVVPSILEADVRESVMYGSGIGTHVLDANDIE